MVISSESAVDCHVHTMMRSNFLCDLGFDFKIGVVIYVQPGSFAKWFFVWRMDQSDNETTHSFQGCTVKISTEHPSFSLLNGMRM